jgi:hypothetical protein
MIEQHEEAHVGLEQLEILVGTWEVTGRTPDAATDDISGTSVFEPILGGAVLQMRGTMRFNDTEFDTLELIWHDARTGDCPAHVYSSEGAPLSYRWARTGPRVLTHSGLGATFTGTISEDGNTITGGWRPDPDQEAHPGSSYDAVMRRIG